MKKMYAFLLMVFTVYNVAAQTEHGNWLIGGSFVLNTNDNSTTIGLNPTAGYFVMNNLAVGGTVILNYTKFGNSRSTTFGAGPLVRYYFGQTNIKPFVHGEFGLISEKTKVGANSNTENGINFLLGPGLAGFLNENVALEALAGYSYTKLKDFDGDGGFAFRVGFQVYLRPRRAVEQIRTGQ
ncbi:MAG TPA: outer membrane beta-barrel protein [Chitinophagaceae bacterium]|nr:outer membrane beta-barrel protein [Chitinophagaceae bacterium]